ncbi:hypothetical protein [Thiothrix unzii]|jgi:hypothetical protein|uniref:hypothetical protein n=1 Tax=Thiothrix unzii TaxID=111769 RepID=UPI002A35E365|nr:hypothetical protein [Thiothrix unzii]MDX9988767.1 hypothetical protein [Thiothrix unzii]
MSLLQPEEHDESRVITGTINDFSIRAIYLEMYFDNTLLASGTAFFVDSKKGPVMITNRHNLTGRHQETNQPLSLHGGVPNHACFQIIGSHEPFWYAFDLYTDDDMLTPVWIEHPTYGNQVDVVGILFSELRNGVYRFIDVKEDWYTWEVADQIHVIGYPFGINECMGIWATGHIASEPAINYRKLPCFLIDCRTRSGQSGSVVIARFKPGDMVSYEDKHYIAQKIMTHTLGIYSGRINKDSDLGMVWKTSIIRDIIKLIETSKSIIDNKFSPHRFSQLSFDDNC